MSAFALVDADTIVPLALSQDFKRIGEATPGRTPEAWARTPHSRGSTPATESRIWAIVRDTVEALRARSIAYRGLLYTGLMLTADGPKVLEYNCRFGDPETEVVIPQARPRPRGAPDACATDRLADVKAVSSADAAVTVVLASRGYPGRYEIGVPIDGLAEAEAMQGVTVFHGGHRGCRRYSGDGRRSGAVRDRRRRDPFPSRGRARYEAADADLVRREDHADGRRGLGRAA